MEFRHLTYFVAVAEELHFSRAAERLHIVQPALSQQIAKLEAELGVTLLARTKRSVALTDAGRVLLENARTLLELRERAISSARNAGEGHSGILTLGYVGPAAFSVLHPVINAYRTAFPQVELQLDELTTNQQVERLAAGTLDVGIVRLPLPHTYLATRPLITESVVVALPPGHPLADQETVELADLAGEPFVMVPRSREPAVHDRYVSLCLEAGFSPNITHEGRQVHALIELVAASLGVALAPESIAALHRPGVEYRKIVAAAHQPELVTGLVWLRAAPTTLVRHFVETAVTAV